MRRSHVLTPGLTLIVVCAVAAVRYPAFLTIENLLNILRQNSMLGIIAAGMSLVILSGGIDLSVGSVASLSGVVAASMSYHGSVPALASAAALGILAGLINGLLVTTVRLQPFVATLATMMAFRGAAFLVAHDTSVRLAKSAALLSFLGRGRWIGVPIPVILLLGVFAVVTFIARRTRLGLHIYSLGDSEEASSLLGMNVQRTKLTAYAISGVLAASAGVLLAARLGAAQPVAATGWELDAISAVVVGGTLLTGGRGSVPATFIGLLLLGVLLNIFNLEGTISPWWQGLLRGALLLVFVIVQRGTRTQPAVA